jgi:hypothetical protein
MYEKIGDRDLRHVPKKTQSVFDFSHPHKAEGEGRVPHVRPSVRGLKMMGRSPYGRFF